MSKEKNLTIECCGKAACKEAMAYKHYREGVGIVAFGPAIDRLHEFEKLGLEPEEIERTLKINTENLTYLHDRLTEQTGLILGLEKENKELLEEIETLREELAWYTGQHSTLISQNRNQAKTIKRLMGENEGLKDGKYYRTVLERNKELIVENANLKNRLHEKTNEYREKIMAMSEDCDELQEENERLKQYVDLYEHMVDSAINLSTAMLNSLTEAHNERKKES